MVGPLLSGVAMGTRAAPSLANIFCAEIDKEIVKLAETYYKTRQWTPPTCPLPPSTASSRRTRGTNPGRHRPRAERLIVSGSGSVTENILMSFLEDTCCVSWTSWMGS